MSGLHKSNVTQDGGHWAIFDHLDNLQRHIEEKVTKIGDNLINEEEKLDEARRRKREEREAKEAQALLNQQKLIAEAKLLEKQILNNESKN